MSSPYSEPMSPNDELLPATASHRQHVSKASEFARKKQWAAAIQEMCRALVLDADYKRCKSDLLKWIRFNGPSSESRDALQLLAKHDGGYLGLQALKQLEDWAGKASSVESRASRILRRLDMRSRELAILNGSTSPDDRLALLADEERLDEARDLLSEMGLEEAAKLSRRTVLSVIKIFSRHRRVGELRPIIGGAGPVHDDPKTMAAFAYALAVEGECVEALHVLSPLEKEEYTDRAFQTVLRCADERQDDAAAATAVAEWLRFRPSDALPNKRRLLAVGKVDPSRLLADLKTISGDVPFEAKDFSELIESVISEAPEIALEVAHFASTRFPDDERLKRKLRELATSLAEGEMAQREKLKEQVFDELSEELIEAVGPEHLVSSGGASSLHKLLLDSPADGPGEGLLVLAKLCLSTLRVIETRGDHRSRETRELHAAGSASWDALQPKRARLATLTRAICLTALQAGEDHQTVLSVLAQLQSLLLEDSEFSRRLCRFALAEAEAGADISSDIWRTALSCDDIELHADFEARIGDRDCKIMHWKDFACDERGGAPRLQPIHSARSLQKPVMAFGVGFHGEIRVTIQTRAEVLSEPTRVTVYDGHLVSLDKESLWALTPAGFVPPRASSVLLHSGMEAVALRPPSSEIEISTPVLLIPGVAACYRQYFHFAGQILPRILARLHDLGAAGSDLGIALPDFAAPFIFDMLELSGIGRDGIVLIPSLKTVRLTRALVANPSLDDWQCAPEDISIARKTLAARAKPPAARRVYVSRPLASVRSRGRTISNEVELLEIATRFGFEIVDPASMSQPEQRQLFGETEVLCGPVGAGMTNILYLPCNSKVVCIGPVENTATFYPGLTLGQQITFTWVLGNYDPAFVNSRHFPHLPFSVRPADFERALESACS